MKKIENAITVYLLLMIIILFIEPSCAFDENGEMKSLGIGEDKTMFSFFVISIFTACLVVFGFYFPDILARQQN